MDGSVCQCLSDCKSGNRSLWGNGLLVVGQEKKGGR